MKNLKFFFILLLALLGFSNFSKVEAQQANVEFSTFYNDLGHYGRWMNHPRFGQVWIYNEPNFRPYYTGGHWDYTSYGWTWVSDYDWGWAPFHYGRWESDPELGWIWIPGYDWAPAWVAWGEYGNNYGWAPLGYGMQIGVNLSFGAIPYNRWVFGPREYMNNPRFYDYYNVPNRNWNGRNVTIINNIYNDRRSRYMTGPDRNEVERYSRSNVEVRRFDDNRIGRGEVVRNQNYPNNPNERMNNNAPVRGAEINNNRNREVERRNTDWPSRTQNNPVVENRNTPPVRNMDNRNREFNNRDDRQRQPVFENREPQQRSAPTNERRAEVRSMDSRPRNEGRINNDPGTRQGGEQGGWHRRN